MSSHPSRRGFFASLLACLFGLGATPRAQASSVPPAPPPPPPPPPAILHDLPGRIATYTYDAGGLVSPVAADGSAYRYDNDGTLLPVPCQLTTCVYAAAPRRGDAGPAPSC